MDKKINVLHILWSGGIGGTEEYVTSLIRCFNSSKYKLHLCFISRKGAIFEEVKKKSKNITFIGMINGFDIAGALRLFKYLQRKKIDLMHSHSANILSTMVISFFNKPKKIFTEHVSPGSRDFCKKRKIFYRLFANSFHKIITISMFVKRKLVEDMGLSSSKIVVIHNGIQIDKYNSVSLPPQDLLHIKKNNKYILGFIGRMEDFKRPYLFIDVAKEIIRKQKKFHFIMVGDGPELAKCKNMISNYGMNNYFTLLGFRRDIPNILKMFDALFFSSSGEGFGMVILEAMAAGVPVFAINDGAVSEIITNRKNGVLLDTAVPSAIAQRIIDSFKDKKLIEKIKLHCNRDVRAKFSIELCVKKMEQLYAVILDNK